MPPSTTTAASSGQQPVGSRWSSARRGVVGGELADAGDQELLTAWHLPDRLRERRGRSRSRSPCRKTTGRRPSTRVTSSAPRRRPRCARRPGAGGAGLSTSRSRGRRADRRRSRPASSQPRLAWPAAVAARTSSAACQCPRCWLTSRSSSSTARISSKRSITAWLSEPRVSRAPASASARLGPTPSPRSRSVVGQKDTKARASPSSETSSSVEVGGVHADVSRAQETVVGEQPGRADAVRREAPVVLRDLLGEVHVQGRPRPTRRDRREAGPAGSARTEWSGAGDERPLSAGRPARRPARSRRAPSRRCTAPAHPRAAHRTRDER